MKFAQVLLVLMSVFFITGIAHSQDRKSNEIIEVDGKQFFLHEVKKGETIYSICKLYQVENKDLLNNNPQLIYGLKEGASIKVPYEIVEEATEKPALEENMPGSFIQHTIKKRETPYFIAKKYGIAIEDIYKYNPQLKKFKRNATIRIPQWDIASVPQGDGLEKEMPQSDRADNLVDGVIVHRVKPGETAYSLSKLYGCSIGEIYSNNPEARNMRIGMEIRIPNSAPKVAQEPGIETEGGYFFHMIETGETLFGLQRKYHVPKEELLELNPALNSGFPAGVKIKIPVKYMPQQAVRPVNEDAFIQHEVQKGETLTRLSLAYGLTISEIKKYNPALASRDGLMWGETILIPKKPREDMPQPVENNEVQPNVTKAEYYDIEYIEELPGGCGKDEQHDFFFKTYHVG